MFEVETDAQNDITIYRLSEKHRSADNLYGEQPYSSKCGSRVAIRYYPTDGENGGLSIYDLKEDIQYPVQKEPLPTLPAFNGWGEYIWYQTKKESSNILMRCNYNTLRQDEVVELPEIDGRLSYGTVSHDQRYFAAVVRRKEQPVQLMLITLADGTEQILIESEKQYFKHEQFSRDGRNRILIQANSLDKSVVNLGVFEIDTGELSWLPVDSRPPTDIGIWPGKKRYTPRCTGHETWIGQTEKVFLSTGYDENAKTNIWSAATADISPTVVCKTSYKFGHVSVSRCGRYWIADAPSEDGIPIYGGSFNSGQCRRLLYSRTQHDGKQWSHTHPYLTADNRWLIFTSNRSGKPQVYGARMEGDLSAILSS